jgi:hypothetical protein
VFEVGFTTMLDVVAPLDQEKVPPVGFTVANRVSLDPLQMVVVVGKLTVGTGLTATVTVSAKDGHPFSV